MIARHSAAVVTSSGAAASSASTPGAGAARSSAAPGIPAAMMAKLKKLTTSAPIMLFMKGSPDAPKCKFSRAMVALLAAESVSYGSFDILSSPDVRAQLKVFSGQKTYPQLYKAGKLVGGLDTVKGIKEKDGHLHSLSTGAASSGAVVPASASASATAAAAEEEEKPVETKEELTARLTKLTTQAQVVLFMKGNPETPRCGFSRKMVALLQQHDVVFKDFDILEDSAVREGLKEFANWPTYPQLWVNGELQGGLDVLNEIAEDAEDAGDDEGGLKGALGIVDINTRLSSMVKSARVFLFMKGDPAKPRCGFSRKMVALLRENGIAEFDTFDVLGDPEVRSGVKTFSDWPTFPQLYVDGKFAGGLDVITEMAEDAEDGLKEELGL
jgi:Grx4 family monothiol glutaredoxin